MNRNANSHFAVNPTNLDIGRSRFETPFNHTLTGQFAELIPFFWTEILPGDTLTIDDSKVIRMTTLLDPVFGNAFCDTYYFFVPMRLVWSHTKEFFGENTTGPWAPSTTYTIPQISFTATPALMTVADYMGIPQANGFTVSALPFRAYTKIYMDWFMDQNTMTPPALSLGDSTVTYSWSRSDLGGTPYKAAKYHDYFTSALPAPQRGSAVLIPFTGSGTVSISGSFPVTASGSIHSMGNAIQLAKGSDTTGENLVLSNGTISGSPREIGLVSGTLSGYTDITKSNLVTAVSGSGSVSGISSTTSVNDLRMAFQLQKWYERSAMFGGRYIEMIKAQFGVTSPDARLQRSEYLGGNRVPLSIQSVENTNGNTGTGAQPLGKLGAYSHTSDANHAFTHSFTEHGFVIGITCCRYLHQYPQGLNRAWSRQTMFDFYFPVFANLGNQAIKSKEIYLDGSSADDNVFGYSEAWAEYRYMPDRVSGMMRPGVSGSLASWNFSDYYTSRPTLSSGWIVEDKSPIDRALAVPSSGSVPQLLMDIGVNCTWVRAMPLYSIPGLIDHH